MSKAKTKATKAETTKATKANGDKHNLHMLMPVGIWNKLVKRSLVESGKGPRRSVTDLIIDGVELYLSQEK